MYNLNCAADAGTLREKGHWAVSRGPGPLSTSLRRVGTNGKVVTTVFDDDARSYFILFLNAQTSSTSTSSHSMLSCL